MSRLKVVSEDQPGTATRLEQTLHELAERLGAERWVLCRMDGGEWGTHSLASLPRDHVYLSLVGQLGEMTPGWHSFAPAELGDAGLRLQIAGVGDLAVLSSSLRGTAALVFFENPVSGQLEAATGESDVPEDLIGLYEATSSGDVPADDRWDHEMRWLWEMLPSLGSFAGGRLDETAAVERLGNSLGARAVVTLVPRAGGIGVVASTAGPDGHHAERARLEAEGWESVTAEPSASLARALQEAKGTQVVGSWAVSWAAGNRVLLGIAPGGRRPSQEALDVASTLIGWAFGESEGTAAAGRHALLQERSRIASVIHEGLTQVVTNVAIQLQVLERFLGDPDKAAEMVRSSRSAVLAALDDLRGAIFELAPRLPDSGDLAGGITRYVNDFAGQWGINIECSVSGDERPVDPEIAALLFAFIQEGLTNVRKHAASADTTVEVIFGDESVAVSVSDTGKGFDPSSSADGGYRKHQGLSLLRSRVWLMGGTIDVDSAPGRGSTLRMEIST